VTTSEADGAYQHVESQDVIEAVGSFYQRAPVPAVKPLVWTVTIAYSRLYSAHRITARERETGASLDPQHKKSLAKARDVAGRMATVLRGTMYDYDWRNP